MRLYCRLFVRRAIREEETGRFFLCTHAKRSVPEFRTLDADSTLIEQQRCNG